MRCIIFVCLGLLATTTPYIQAAPVPKPKDATPAVIDAGCEKNIAWVLENVVSGARIGVRENKKVADLDIIRRQKDWESWLQKNLRLDRIEDTNRVRISFRDGSPQEQAAIINVVVNHYLANDVGSRRQSLTRDLKRLRNALDDCRRLLARGKVTAKEVESGEQKIKILEERLRRFPRLVHHAKTE